jgi:hypothetical protein
MSFCYANLVFRIGQSIGQNPPLCVANRLTIETYGGMLSANTRFVARISAAQFTRLKIGQKIGQKLPMCPLFILE